MPHPSINLSNSMKMFLKINFSNKGRKELESPHNVAGRERANHIA